MGTSRPGLAISSLLTTWNTYRLLSAPTPDAPQTGPWRPPQWNGPQLTAITVPASATGAKAEDGGDTGFTFKTIVTGTTTYFFDAVLRVEHFQSTRMTEHPVMIGANIVDHAYLMPAVVTLEIGMSDAMATFSAGMYTSNASKSVSAYEQLLKLQADRVPLTLITRLKSYTNMLIESVHAPDDCKTLHGLRATVRMRQILMAEFSTRKVSARPMQTGETNKGPVACTKPSATLLSKHKVVLTPMPNGGAIVHPDGRTEIVPKVPGAGSWTSVATQGIGSTPAVHTF